MVTLLSLLLELRAQTDSHWNGFQNGIAMDLSSYLIPVFPWQTKVKQNEIWRRRTCILALTAEERHGLLSIIDHAKRGRDRHFFEQFLP